VGGGPGKDALGVRGGDGDDVFTVDTAMIALADMQIGIAGFESVSINGGRGANTVVLQGTQGADTLAVGTDSVGLNGRVIHLSYVGQAQVWPGAGNDVV